jgi:transcriptional regulator with XRE-family HTH domain
MNDDTSLTDDLAKLGRALREVREQQGLSEHDLAAATGITPEDMRALEAGKLDPDYELLIVLARRLGVTPALLVVRAQGPSAE